MTLTGVMAGPIAGLKYETPTHRGLTDGRGEFSYEEGERVAFLLGHTAIGNVTGRPTVNLAQIVARVDGNLHKLKDAGITNIARLVFTLGRDDVRDHGTVIAPEVHEIIGDRRLDFRHDVNFEATGTVDKVQQFTDDPVVAALLDALNQAGVFAGENPRELCTPAKARNEVRRNAMGVLRFRDVEIPLANGAYVLADVFRPAEPGRYPAIVSCGPYGKAFNHHSIAGADDLELHELMEEDYFCGNAGGVQFENHETVNTAVWVPEGYAVIRVDKFYLDGRTRSLTTDVPAVAVEAAYTADSNPSAVSFVTRFEEETTLVGYSKAHLFVEARGSDDMDLFVLVQKLDRWGTPLQAFTVSNQSAMAHDLTDHGATILRYKGIDGRLRASARHLDERLATDDVPAHTFDRVEKLSPGEIVELDIDLMPAGLTFHPGEQLRFIVSSTNLLGTLMPAIREYVGENAGQHVIHAGGDTASYLQLPERK